MTHCNNYINLRGSRIPRTLWLPGTVTGTVAHAPLAPGSGSRPDACGDARSFPRVAEMVPESGTMGTEARRMNTKAADLTPVAPYAEVLGTR